MESQGQPNYLKGNPDLLAAKKAAQKNLYPPKEKPVVPFSFYIEEAKKRQIKNGDTRSLEVIAHEIQTVELGTKGN